MIDRGNFIMKLLVSKSQKNDKMPFPHHEVDSMVRFVYSGFPSRPIPL